VTTHSEAGKGDDMRPTNHDAYSNNYDRIWGKKVRRETADEINQQLQDALAEDDEFERVQREQEQRVGNHQDDVRRST
jgi:lysozyme family protein